MAIPFFAVGQLIFNCCCWCFCCSAAVFVLLCPCSNLPARFKLWRDVAVKGSVQTLDKISPGWLAAYKGYYADAGDQG